MKVIQPIYVQPLILIAFIVGLGVLHAQENPFQGNSTDDMDAMLQAIEATTPLPADNATNGSNFYSAQHAPGSNEEWPPLPGDVLGLDVWPLGDGTFLLDDRDVDYAVLSGGTMRAMNSPMGFMGATFTTNDLWLEITGKTNATAYLVIHPPWNVTNGVYDLLYCTNLALPIAWQWILRTDPGQTNLEVSNAIDPQGFYRLGAPNDLVANDSLGTNFWIAFMYMANNNDLSLYISSPVATTGAVTIPFLGITNTFSLAAGAVTNMPIDTGVLITDYDVVEAQGINITSSHPVSVYAFGYQQAASAAFTCYATPLLGTNYCVMARPSYVGYSSEFAIVATADNTTVTITPSTNADLDGSLWTNPITLQQGQTYQIDGEDVTGTLIASDKPVGVFAGASLARVPDMNTLAGNPLVQEQLPVEAWGTQALSIGFAGRTNGDSYRILAAYGNTVVTVTTTNGTFTTNLTAGVFCDTNLAGPVQFQANQPIQVAHFANGHSFDGVTYGDPCEILLLPTGRYLETNVVYTTGLDSHGNPIDIATNYLNLIVAQSAVANTFVDGSTVAATNFVAIGTSGYSGARLSVTNSVHKIISSQPVGVEVYGWGVVDAYGYFGGVVK